MGWNRGVRVAGALLACVTAWQCGSSDGGPTQPPATLVPTTVTKTGDGQSGTVSAALPATIGVTVRDQNGALMAGVTVTFTVTAGGGRTVGTSAVTTAQGVASVTWILGTTSGTNNNTVTAGIPGYQGAVPTFTASAASGAAAKLIRLAGESQVGEVVQPYPQPLSVRVEDLLNNPVVGAIVTWSAIEGRGVTMPGTSVTDASGVASAEWSPGPVVGANLQKVRVYVPGAPWEYFTGSATLSAGTLTIAFGDNQTGVISTPAPLRPTVVVTTPGGGGVPVEGVFVGWEVTAGGGSLSTTQNVTDAGGTSSTEWMLGATVGINNQGLRATVAGLTGSPASFVATATQRPTQIAILSGNGQAGTVGTLLAQPLVVQVRDSAGAPVAGTTVVWDFPEGATSSVTNAAGQASLAFTLFPTAGTQLVGARVPAAEDPGVIVLFQFNAVAGPPARIERYTGDFQTAIVGAVLPEPVSVLVRDAYGNVRSGATVNWAPANGSTGVASSVTDANGYTSTTWTLGTVAGTRNQFLTARLAAVAGMQETFTATANPGPPSSLTLVSGDNQSAVIGNPLSLPLVASVKDLYGNPVPNVEVRWGPGIGGGWTTASSVRTLADGSSTTRRTLGAGVGAQTTIAAVTGTTPANITFNATGSAFVSEYNIDLRYLTAMSPSRQLAFVNAAARWSSIIYGNLTSVPLFQAPGSVCGPTYPGISETIDDILIFVTIDSIDGPGGILGSAGPCLIRSGSKFTAVGAMRFDSSDLALLDANGVFSAVILHEMGHVIGFGTLWTVPPSLLVGGGTSEPYFPGVNAVDAFTAACCAGVPYFGPRVPVEAGGGPGTRDAHWRESVMGAELMTGYISLTNNPLSAITVGSLRDMGYTVSSANADPYSVSSANLRAPGQGGGVHLVEAIPDWTVLAIDAGGRLTRVR